jgi:hypothetical protein
LKPKREIFLRCIRKHPSPDQTSAEQGSQKDPGNATTEENSLSSRKYNVLWVKKRELRDVVAIQA